MLRVTILILKYSCRSVAVLTECMRNKMLAKIEKNSNGLKWINSEKAVLMTLKPSLNVFSFDVLPSGRLL